LDGGWDAVDALYDTPPTSTVEVIAPDRIGQSPAAVAPLGTPGASWTEARHDSFGAADLMFLFEAPGDDESRSLTDPLGAASAWAGGEYAQYLDGDANAIGVSLTAVDGQEEALCDAMDEFVASADLVAVPTLVCDGASIRLGLAPDTATSEAIAG
jgi:hypothetical protein